MPLFPFARFSSAAERRARKQASLPRDTPRPQTARSNSNPFSPLRDYYPLRTPEGALYEKLREGVPLIDAAILKIVRLVGGFSVQVNGRQLSLLDRFVQDVPSSVGTGLEAFMSAYLDGLLTYGNAVGELVTESRHGRLMGLYHADLSALSIRPADNCLGVTVYRQDGAEGVRIPNQNLLLFTALNPKAGQYTGDSILRSLPFVTDILFKIYHSIGQNFERVGNVRYAITYKPGSDAGERAFAKERARHIADEWADGMEAVSRGQVKDFVAVGDVDIKVIGADNQIIESEVPVRQMLEQIVAKLGVPPFLLGLNWSTTERMSKQQTDILITELTHYRRLLTPVILKICRTFLTLSGVYGEPEVIWDTINLQDQTETAQARYYKARAREIEQNLPPEIPSADTL